MVYYKCTEKCTTDLQKIITTTILDLIFHRSKTDKVANMCHYVCLRELNLKNIKRNGRWGFCPILGMTEFFSVVFSFTNLILNIYSFKIFLRPNLKNLRLRNLFILQCYIQNMAFISSTLFHIHENSFTRNMDYFFAVLVLLYAFYMSIIRTLIIYRAEHKTRYFLRTVFVLYYIYHISRMSVKEFDYVFNKISCVFIITFTFIFHFFIYAHYRSYRYVRNLVFFTCIFFIAGYIEVQDLPPYSYLMDSHAAWHLFGCLSTPFYMKFWGDDIKHHRLLYNNINMKRRIAKR
ncbi:hypothetical protein P3W45_000939 [Vairimorpha bombi]|jgi:post-GPI attachment to proteins factor 3